jgi:hypothetical protein
MTVYGRHPFQLSFLYHLTVSLSHRNKYNAGVRRKVEWKWLSCCTVHLLLGDVYLTQLIYEVGWVSCLEGDKKQGLMAVLYCRYQFVLG